MAEHKVGEKVMQPEKQVHTKGGEKSILQAARDAWGPEGKPKTEAEKKHFAEKMRKIDDEAHKKGGPLEGKNDLHVVGYDKSGNLIVAQMNKGDKHANHLLVVNKEGKIVKTAECDDKGKPKKWEGYQTTDGTDGSRTKTYPDKSKIVVDKDGRPTSVTDANGKEQKFGYNKSGELNYYKDKSGAEWESTDGGKTWAKKGTRDTWKGKISVDNEGKVTIEGEDKSKKTINRNGSQVDQRSDGKITGVTDAKGTRREFGYDQTGNPNSYKGPDGEWESKDGGKTWTKKGTNETWKGTVETKDDGSVIWKGDDGKTTTHNADGTTKRGWQDGSEVNLNKDGKVTSTKNSKGEVTTYEYEGDKVKSATVTDTTGEKHIYQRNADGSWSDNGKASNPPIKDISVDADGNRTIEYNDGTKKVFKRDGSDTATSSNKEYVKGQVAEYKTDEKGPTYVKLKDGTVIQRKEGSNNVYVMDNGKGNVSIVKNLVVDKEGNLSYLDGQRFYNKITADGSHQQWRVSHEGQPLHSVVEIKDKNGELNLEEQTGKGYSIDKKTGQKFWVYVGSDGGVVITPTDGTNAIGRSRRYVLANKPTS